MKKLLLLLVFAVSAHAANWYVDSQASSGGNGKSWATAWKNLSNITGVSAGDTVEISGGQAGQSQTYTLSSPWAVKSGSSAGRITYQIGQDSAHNGTATFNCAGLSSFITGNPSYFNLVGDAGDGKMHFAVSSDTTGNFTAFGWSGTTSNVRLGYINLNSQGNNCFSMYQGASQVEIDHTNYVGAPSKNEDSAASVTSSGQDWNSIRIHDNTWSLCHALPESNMGDDVLQGRTWSGVSVYNNTFIGTGVTNYQGGQHQDGSQPLGGDHCLWYNNYVQDMVNYALYGDAYYDGFNGFYIFNNVIAIVSSGVRNNPAAGGLVVGSEIPNGNNHAQTTAPFSDIICANNLVVDFSGHWGIAVGTGGSGTIKYNGTNFRIQNNAIINTSPNTVRNDTHFTISDNPELALSTGANYFVSYTKNKANEANFNLVAGSKLIGAGVNLTGVCASPEITFDRNGVKRPATGAWDIGPYQYSSTGPSPTPNPTPTATPSATPTPAPTATPTPAPSATPAPSPTPSTAFKVGDVVTISSGPASVRSSPAGALTGTQATGAIGTVTGGPIWMPADPAILDNVAVHWWQVEFSQTPNGWLGESALALAPKPTPTPAPSATPTPAPTPAPGQSFEKWIEKQNDWIRANPPLPD